ncbi:hypothetical protein [Micromonospora sp. NPDC093244]|uniref:hypothetical protein n=1 Tax=Micromonospora sp. NPDC093244 TaxID=3155071 RepID=UPI003430D38C
MFAVTVLAAAACSGSSSSGDGEAPGTTSLVLSKDGIGLAKFGDSIESVSDRVHARWGPSESREAGCDSHVMSKFLNWDGVFLVFSADGLVGYLIGPRPADSITPVGKDVQAAATVEGLRLGDSVRKARQVYGARFVLEENSLGPEFYIAEEQDDWPALMGFSTGLTDADTIKRIGAGDICAVR